jgi:hypothetical protein
MLNTQGNLVVIYNTVDGKEIAEKFSDEDPSSYGFMLRKIIERFEEMYTVVNDEIVRTIKGVEV